jgi:exopolyphosphatase/guanosine-5'-triphosphate,3'-diphosphate pyrophosphatase
MAKYASIDIGTQTIRLLIAEIDNSGRLFPVFRNRLIVRLGEGMHENNSLKPTSMRRALTCIKNFKKDIDAYGVTDVFAVATSCVREAENGKLFLDKITHQTGISPRLLTGEEEAQMSLKGVQSVFERDRAPSYSLIIDIGGGSTELIVTAKGKMGIAESLPLGVVHLSEKYLLSDPPLVSELDKLKESIFSTLGSRSAALKKLSAENKINIRLIGTAGTVTTLAAMDLKMKEYAVDRINSHLLTRSAIEELYQKMISLSSAKRKKLSGLEKGREVVIIAGTHIILAIMYLIDVYQLWVSDAGLLEGILLEATG